MTTNQTIDGELRELLERILSYTWFPSGDVGVFDLRLIDREQLRALLDAPAPVSDGVNWKAVANEQMGIIQALKAAQPQAEFDYNGWSIDHSAGRPILMHNSCSVIEAEQAYGLLELIKTATRPQGKPVAWQYMTHPTWDKGDWPTEWTDCTKEAHDDYARAPVVADWEYRTRKLYAEQPAPVAVDVLSTGFYTTESGGGKYAINIGFRSMADMQAADAQLRELLKSR